MTRIVQFITVTLVSLATLSAHPAEPSLPSAGEILTNRPTARELLQWFDEEQAKLKSFIAEYEYNRQDSGAVVRGGKSSYSIAGETRFDGRRCSVRTREWGQVLADRQWTKEKPNYDSHLYDGQWVYHYGHFFWRLDDVPKGQPVGSLILASGKDTFSQMGYPLARRILSTFSMCALRR